MSRRADIHKCLECGNDYLEGYPHHHERPLQPGYDPMPPKPKSPEALVALIRSEYLAEIPSRIHVAQVPSHAEPIGVSQYSAEAAGWVMTDASVEVLDTGQLGSPPWSVPFHRRIGSYRFWEGEIVQADAELRDTPWTRNLNGVKRWCLRSHRGWYEHRGEPLCWLLTRLVTEAGYPVGRAAQELARHGFAISPEKAERLLFGYDDGKHHNGAFDQWWAWTSEEMNGLTLRRVRKPAA